MSGRSSDGAGPFGRPIAREESLAGLQSRPQKAQAEPDPIEKLTERFEPRAPFYRLEDVVLPEAAAREVASVLAKVKHHVMLYETWQLARLEPSGRRLVFSLYGPPGTGKTMLADAIAGRLGKNVIEVSYAEIESKYVGETPKNIVAAFRAAERHGAALFFDEADSILGKRMTHVTQAADHGVNVSRAVMLKELDRFQGVVMFATNLARNFDGAFVRRILYHIAVPVPDAAARERLWRALIPDAVPGKAALDFPALAERSPGLVGGEIKNAVILAATDAVQRDGEARRVTMADFTAAIEFIYRAKREVGGFDVGGTSGVGP